MQKKSQNKGFQFLLGILGIYSCYWSSGYLQEKILKKPYAAINSDQIVYFDSPISLIWMQSCVAWILGYFINQSFYSRQTKIPTGKMMVCATLVTVSALSSILAIKITSFPIVMMIKSCSIIPVVFVGIFCSKVKDQSLKLGAQKIIIALIISIGILIYNFGGSQTNITTPTSILGIFLMLISVTADGFLPDVQAVIKSQSDLLPTQMFEHTNKWVALISLLYACMSGGIGYLIQFAQQSPECIGDLLLFSILGAIGQIFVYRLVKQFKQHIVPFVITTRKIFTVVISIIVYKHETTVIQVIGIVIVFMAASYQYCHQIFIGRKQNKQEQVVLYMIKDEIKNDKSINDNTQSSSNQKLQMVS